MSVNEQDDHHVVAAQQLEMPYGLPRSSPVTEYESVLSDE